MFSAETIFTWPKVVIVKLIFEPRFRTRAKNVENVNSFQHGLFIVRGIDFFIFFFGWKNSLRQHQKVLRPAGQLKTVGILLQN